MHRDIKPANILLGNDDRVWLVDFGLAKANPVESSGGPKLTQAIGTFGYTPLEQWLGQPVPVSDVYAIGATLHHLVTGLHPSDPFEEGSGIDQIQALHSQFSSVRKVDKSLPKGLDTIIANATSDKSNKRPTTLQLQQKLESLISGPQATVLYAFKNGQTAKTVRDLADLCDKNRREAQDYLYNGDFERWFRVMNRHDLTEAAAQAVKQGRNKQDGLKRFLKLIAPNLFLRRLGRAGWRVSRLIFQFVFILAIVIALVVVGGSYGAKWLIKQAIGNYAWEFGYLTLDSENRFTEQEINESAQIITASFIDDIQIDISAPDQAQLKANWGGVLFEIPVAIQLEEGKPHFYLTEINGIPLFFIADNLSQGINEGIERAFQTAPFDISDLEVREREVIFKTVTSGRSP